MTCVRDRASSPANVPESSVPIAQPIRRDVTGLSGIRTDTHLTRFFISKEVLVGC